MSEYQPSEYEIDAYGRMLAGTKFGTSILGTVLLTVQVLMVLLVSFIILVASSADTCIDIWGYYRVLYHGGPTGKSYVEASAARFEADQTIDLIGDALVSIAIATGDVLMLWRCLVIWSGRRWVVIFPGLTCLGSITCNAAFIARSKTGPYTVANAERLGRTLLASISLGVAANIMITLLILLRLALTWKATRDAFPDRKPPRMYSDVAAILIESAAPLAIFGISMVVARAIRTAPKPESLVEKGKMNIAHEVIAWLYYGFCALSPQMIIFRVTTGQSWKGVYETSNDVGSPSQPIQFASTPTSGSAELETKHIV
ncbi:hypothetical protein BKA70DRAFT_1535722 [Coprinopsis sp. MPI-PUGE-AT-0042]|nr:hypothetical protein BKA70DRAFT_1535722 [Coprinopsis sp. MPI-PUGE-AT-0042]